MQSTLLGSVRWLRQNWQLGHLSTLRKTPRGHHLSTSSSHESSINNAQVVICGGGIAGTSLAYHLAKRGWQDVLLLEQGSLTCGTTWHASGLVGLVKGDSGQGELAKYSANLYETLEQETGLSTGYKRTGALFLATTENRMIQLKRLAVRARCEGVDCHLLNPGELQDVVPWISVDDVLGGIYSPRDGVTEPTNTVMALARGATNKGLTILEKVEVKQVLTESGRVSGVETEDGQVIQCQYFVNAAGLWARNVGQRSNPSVSVPLQANQHQYAVFKPKQGVDFNTPYVRDQDHGLYIREWSEGIMAGIFAQNGKPVFLDGKPPVSEFMSLPDDWDAFDPHFQSFLKRVPCAKDLELRQLFNGPESFTPDMQPLVGQAPEISNYFVMAGFHSQGVTFGGGAGKYLADWIIDGKPSRHMASLDIKRFAPHHNRLRYLQERATETEGRSYKLSPPNSEFEKGRKLCCTALYGTLSRSGAVFGETMGMELPLYFDKKGNQPDTPDNVWGKPTWFDIVLAEYQACQQNVAVVDLSAMAVFELQSSSADCLNPFLQKLCASRLGSPGSCTNTWMLNGDANIVSDCVVTCTSDSRYIIMSSAKQWTATKAWLTKHLPEDQSIVFKDLTPGSEAYKMGCYSILGVIGPKAEKVFKKLTDGQDMNSDTVGCYKYGSNGHIITTTLCGAKGFLLLLPHQIAEVEYNQLMSCNQDLKIKNVGHYALRWIQAENDMPSYGTDYNANNTPREVKLATHQIDLQKSFEFIGQKAVAATKSEETTRQLIHLALNNHVNSDIWPWGSEPIYLNDKVVGMTTSASYSPANERILFWGQVETHRDDMVSSEEAGYEVDIAGKRYKAELYSNSTS
ncbi:pyruvate dehydrogenase phosphatase regulatory subunit, mitochondrial-like [Amphiura filiformis]|uniref:pyruvate dehydrogenase phosphatase regulatory subunit, mitochondrial-like n=1 Tax=Amphiura filiformis TaxID=82378 RepID=UPI003B21927E